MSVTNTKGNAKGPASGEPENPKDGSDCPEKGKGGWGSKEPVWKIEVEQPLQSAKDAASKLPKVNPQPKITILKAPTGPAGTEALRKQKALVESQRAMYEEKTSNYRIDFTKVSSAPGPSKEEWWYPDPYTGTYVPENHFGEISRGFVEQKANSGGDKPKQDPVKTVVQEKNKMISDNGGKKWLVSMEDLPDSLP
jgi:hypothetical protein